MRSKLNLLTLSFMYLSCSENNMQAGAVIDTSTLSSEVQGRRINELEGQWLIIENIEGKSDSVRINPLGSFLFDYLESNSLKIQTDSLWYFAYKIYPSDTIRPSAPLRFAFPNYPAWDSLNPPTISSWNAPLIWSTLHQVWTTDSLPAGRHLIEWDEAGQNYSADLILSEMANRFDLHQYSTPIQNGSLRPMDCGFIKFKPFEKGKKYLAGYACPHTESDAFNREGNSQSSLISWSDSLLRFQLTTLSNYNQTANPYSKLMFEFGPNEEAFDLTAYDSISIEMNLSIDDHILVRMSDKKSPVGQWHYTELIGDGSKIFTFALDTTLQKTFSSGPLDLSEIFGLEFRNPKSGTSVLTEVYSVTFK